MSTRAPPSWNENPLLPTQRTQHRVWREISHAIASKRPAVGGRAGVNTLELDEIPCPQLLPRDWAPAGLEDELGDHALLEDVARLARDDRLDRRVARHRTDKSGHGEEMARRARILSLARFG